MLLTPTRRCDSFNEPLLHEPITVHLPSDTLTDSDPVKSRGRSWRSGMEFEQPGSSAHDSPPERAKVTRRFLKQLQAPGFAAASHDVRLQRGIMKD